jgi:hypothetical protein
MSVNQLLSTVVLVAFIVTLVLAVGSYLAYKSRERRRPRGAGAGDGDAPVFFERVFPAGRREPTESAERASAGVAPGAGDGSATR